MISFKHVYKVYGGRVRALKDLSFEVEEGEMVFLNGPSGAGKSTIFNIVAGFLKPTSGKVIVQGRDLGSLSFGETLKYRRDIGVIFQDFQLLDDRTVYENIRLPLDILKFGKSDKDKKIREVAENLEIQEKLSARAEELSGGQKQRVAIARALVSSPRLIIADEPTGNVDKKMSTQIMDTISAIRSKGTTVMVASHDDEMVEGYAQRVLNLQEGSLIS